METHADPQPSDESSPPAAAYPSWILFAHFGGRSDDPDDSKTVAHARTSTGHPFSVSLVLAAPPAASGLRLQTGPGLPDGVTITSHTIAADGDSVLVEVETRRDGQHGGDRSYASDYFLYCAGDAAAEPSRPPSLCLLPPCYLTEQQEWKPKVRRYMDNQGTALLRRGQDDQVLVASLDSRVKDWRTESGPLELELCLLRSGDWEWELMLLPVIHDEGKREEVSCWWTDGVIPAGDRYLLWVDYFRGIIFSDVWQDAPELRYVSLPVDPSSFRDDNRGGASYRCVCATDAGPTVVRFVEVLPRCCCGCPGETACPVSRYAFTITTWALRMDDVKAWDKVAVIDCDELWSLSGYRGVVPRITPTYPILSLNDPDVLCFMVDKNMYHDDVDGENGTRLIELDTRRMELRSVRYYDDSICFVPNFITSAVSQYFDPSSCNRTLATRKDTDTEAPARPSKLTFPRVVPPESMLATLRETPNLTRDEMLKAYVVLACDESQFKFRSLLALPVAMRKDYCLLIGKLSCFDV